MSPTWKQRQNQLANFLKCNKDDEDEIGLKLDEVLFGNHDKGRPDTHSKVDSVQFTDKDVESHGVLANGQFGTVELVTCKFDGRVYVRKRMPKRTVLRHREQCAPLTERRIYRTALRELSSWVPRMLCAYQSQDFLNIIMEYAEGGSLWDVIESSPNDGRLSFKDLRWWIPQCVSAIEWCHQQGFVHRDVKPHNFVFRPDGHLLLIDFGSAAPLLPPQDDGVQLIPREYCLIPCGTCDYVSPEILKAHEEALVALEMSDGESDASSIASLRRKRLDSRCETGYGRETDWWSLGAMVYEMTFGVAPFFANDVRHTYTRIMNHETSLNFDESQVHPDLISLLKGLLTDHKSRLGRHSVEDLKTHAFFNGIDWMTLPYLLAPPNLLLPEFTYTAPVTIAQDKDVNDTQSLSSSTDSSRPFAFSALFQSTIGSTSGTIDDKRFVTPEKSRRNLTQSANSVHTELASFIGFSWGPQRDAFDNVIPQESVWRPTATSKAIEGLSARAQTLAPVTPARPSAPTPRLEGMSTIRVTRGWSTVKRSQHRPVTDREAMKQLVDCIGMSARKRVLESGKKPRILQSQFDGWAGSFGRSSLRSVSALVPGTVRKELRFHDKTYDANYSVNAQEITYEASDTSDAEVPPSPSPSPRPGSAMSIISLSRRSATPTVTGNFSFPVRVHQSQPVIPPCSASAFTASIKFRPGESTSTPRIERMRRRTSESRLRRDRSPPIDGLDECFEDSSIVSPSNVSLEELQERYTCFAKNLEKIGVQLRAISMHLDRT